MISVGTPYREMTQVHMLIVLFLQGLLSTVFFNFNGTGLSVSNQWWIFPASVLPLTVIVFGIWYTWLQYRIKRDLIDRKRKEVSEDNEAKKSV
jgi:hypothetical protein